MEKSLVDALVASINDPSAGWTYTKHYAKNPRIKCDMWISNGVPFLEVEFYGEKVGAYKSYRVTGCPLIFQPRWARRIYRAAKPHQRAALSANNRRDVRRILSAIESSSAQVEEAA